MTLKQCVHYHCLLCVNKVCCLAQQNAHFACLDTVSHCYCQYATNMLTLFTPGLVISNCTSTNLFQL